MMHAVAAVVWHAVLWRLIWHLPWPVALLVGGLAFGWWARARRR